MERAPRELGRTRYCVESNKSCAILPLSATNVGLTTAPSHFDLVKGADLYYEELRTYTNAMDRAPRELGRTHFVLTNFASDD